jgi:hypothetical protein
MKMTTKLRLVPRSRMVELYSIPGMSPCRDAYLNNHKNNFTLYAYYSVADSTTPQKKLLNYCQNEELLHYFEYEQGKKYRKVQISLLQAVEVHRVARG